MNASTEITRGASGGPTRKSSGKGTHNESKRGRVTAEYRAWQEIKRRCYDPARRGWPRYGGRGIRMCRRWKHSFPSFLADMGRKPSTGHSIDRINNDGNYTPSNCRWATLAVQSHNKTAFNIRIGKRSLSLPKWAELSGVSLPTIRSRLKLSPDTHRAIFTPAGQWQASPMTLRP